MDWYYRRPLLWWSIALGCGILLARILPNEILYIFAIVIVCAYLIILGSKKFSHLFIFIIIGAVCVLGWERYLAKSKPPNPILEQLADSETQVFLYGVVTGYDSTRTGKIYYECLPSHIYDKPIKSQPMQMWVPETTSPILVGDSVHCIATVSHYPRARNPGEFDYRNYQQLKGHYFQLNVRYPWQIEIKPGTPPLSYRIIASIQQRIIHFIRAAFDPEPADFAIALLLGKRDNVDQSLVHAYSSLGIIHVLAVSGLHVGYVTLILLALFNLFPVKYRIRVLLTIAGLFFYATLVGFRPSVVRAATMATILLSAGAFEQRYDILNLLGAAGLLILLVDPMQLFQLGFQLSFLAVLGIVLLYRKFEIMLETLGYPLSKAPKPVHYATGLLLVSVAAFLGTIPLTAYQFRIIPVWGLALNLLVIPVIGLIVLTTFVALLTGLVVPGLGALYAEVPNLSIHVLNRIIHLVYNSGFHEINLPGFSGWYVVAAYLILLAIILFPRDALARTSVFGALVAANLLIWTPRHHKPLRITFLDVGQGDAALIETPEKHTILVDAGIRDLENDRGSDVIVPYLKYRGIKKIDVGVMSHPHNDHVGGFPAVLRYCPVNEIWESNSTLDTEIMHEIYTLADSQHCSVRQITAGFDSTIDKLYIQTMFPATEQFTDNPNNFSILQRIEYGETSFLFTGDVEKDLEKYLLEYGDDLHVDVLKVPHHGSSTSSSPAFIDAVDPKYAVVSVGAHNKFNHPSPAVIARYQQSGAKTLLTEKEGAVVFESDGKEVNLIHWR